MSEGQIVSVTRHGMPAEEARLHCDASQAGLLRGGERSHEDVPAASRSLSHVQVGVGVPSFRTLPP